MKVNKQVKNIVARTATDVRLRSRFPFSLLDWRIIENKAGLSGARHYFELRAPRVKASMIIGDDRSMFGILQVWRRTISLEKLWYYGGMFGVFKGIGFFPKTHTFILYSGYCMYYICSRYRKPTYIFWINRSNKYIYVYIIISVEFSFLKIIMHLVRP